MRRGERKRERRRRRRERKREREVEEVDKKVRQNNNVHSLSSSPFSLQAATVLPCILKSQSIINNHLKNNEQCTCIRARIYTYLFTTEHVIVHVTTCTCISC